MTPRRLIAVTALSLAASLSAPALLAQAAPESAPTTATPAPAADRATSNTGQRLDRVAAIVNDGIVLESELEEQSFVIAQRLKQQGLEMPPAGVLRQQVLERLVMQEVQMQRAKRAGIRISDENLNEALGDVAQRNGLQLAQLPEALASQGVDYASYREGLRRELTQQVLRQRDVIQRINVSPRELEQYLEKQKTRPSELNEYNISHILIAVPQAATPQQLDEASRRAADVFERAQRGEDFSQLAVAYSNSQTALEGGSLGWRKGPEIPTVLADLVAKLKPTEISEPLRTPSGYHIVKLNEIRGADVPTVVQQTNARHILLKPVSYTHLHARRAAPEIRAAAAARDTRAPSVPPARAARRCSNPSAARRGHRRAGRATHPGNR